MQIFQVGGSVRDNLLGIDSQDRDWVVVGATPAQMEARGFRQVGADFPVFLHPDTQDEYALARQERKAGNGYHGFEVTTDNVTLEEDLSRRDLTINAMARSLDGKLVDPFDGQADLAAKVLRHVGPAFSEDPLRILRVFRFQARFGPGWTIHPTTAELMTEMIARGEADHLVPERIWKEVARALMEPHPELFVSALARFGLLHHPPFKSYSTTQAPLASIARAAAQGATLPARFALAFGTKAHATPQPGIPLDVLRVSALFAEFQSIRRELLDPQGNPAVVMKLLQRTGWFKDLPVLDELMAAWCADGMDIAPLKAAAQRARAVDTAAISASMPPGPAVGEAINAARHAAILGA